MRATIPVTYWFHISRYQWIVHHQLGDCCLWNPYRVPVSDDNNWRQLNSQLSFSEWIENLYLYREKSVFRQSWSAAWSGKFQRRRLGLKLAIGAYFAWDHHVHAHKVSQMFQIIMRLNTWWIFFDRGMKSLDMNTAF